MRRLRADWVNLTLRNYPPIMSDTNSAGNIPAGATEILLSDGTRAINGGHQGSTTVTDDRRRYQLNALVCGYW